MNGEVKRYRLNDPMDWKEFKSMPDDLKITYINLLRKKFGVPDCWVGEMLGVDKSKMSTEIKRIGLGHGIKHGGNRSWDKEGFLAWWHGVDKLPTPVPEETPVIEEPTQEEKEAIFFGEEKGYVEDDLPFEELDPRADEFTHSLGIPVTATPVNGSMQFQCPADQALNTLAQLLGKTNCAISVMWRVIEEGGVKCEE